MSEGEGRCDQLKQREEFVAALQLERQNLTDKNEQLTTEISSLKAELQALKHSSNVEQQEVDDTKQQLDTMAPILWKGCARMPCGTVRPHVIVKDTNVYVGGGNTGKLESTRTVYKYDSKVNGWSNLPITPYYTFALALVQGYVTVIGGVTVISSLASNALYSFDEEKTKKWCQKFPVMPTKRCASSATSTESYLIVVGGIAENDRQYLNIVEVLDFSTLTWMKADPVPKPVTFMSITACSVTNRIYLLGGLTQRGAIKSVFSCYIPDLITSCHGKTEISAWEVITDAPFVRSGGAAINGKLVTASGLDSSDMTTSTVHAFDPNTRKWRALGEMAAARSSCSLAVLSENRMLVIGGYVDPRNWMSSLTHDIMEAVNLRVPRQEIMD